MRFRGLLPLLLAVAICSPALAETTTVQFVDRFGDPLVDIDIVVETPHGKLVLAGNSTGIYTLDLEPDNTVTFAAIGAPDYESIDFEVPGNYEPPLLVPIPSTRQSCSSATPVAVGSSTGFDTTGAGGHSDFAALTCGVPLDPTADTLWFSVIGNGNELVANTCSNTAYDSIIAVFCDGCSDLTCIDGNDDACGLQSEVRWESQAGAEYWIAVTGFGTASGAGELTISDTGVSSVNPQDCTIEPIGGCCLNDACNVLTEAACDAVGGSYNGDGSNCAPTASGAPIEYVDSPGTPIPDDNPPGILATIEVAEDFLIADLDVDFLTDHTFIGDLNIELTSPAGTTVLLAEGGIGADNICDGEDGADIVFDDEGPDDFTGGSCGTEPVVGAAPTPTGALLAAFDGENAIGTWTLRVSDRAPDDVGSLQRWSLHFDAGTPPCSGACCTSGHAADSACIEMSPQECTADGGLYVGGSCDDVLECAVLAVEMDRMTAQENDKWVVVTWTTAFEINTAAFRVLRVDGDVAKATATVGMLPSVGNGLQGASYQIVDLSEAAESATYYFIEEIDAFGRETRYGPIPVRRNRKPGQRVNRQRY